MKSESYWKSKLTPEQYNICRLQGTEPAFSGIYNKHDKNGTYCCVACETPLFESQYKYDSGSGWPSFTKSIKDTIIYKEDISHGIETAPKSLVKLLNGSNLGKQLVKV